MTPDFLLSASDSRSWPAAKLAYLAVYMVIPVMQIGLVASSREGIRRYS